MFTIPLDADSFEEQSWENVSEINSDTTAQGGAGQGEVPPPPTATNKKRLHAELTPQQEGDDSMRANDDHNKVGDGRMTRARARAQQQHTQQPGIDQEDSFEVPGLMTTRRGGPPNKMARRK